MAQPDDSEFVPEPPPGKQGLLQKALRRPNANPLSTPNDTPQSQSQPQPPADIHELDAASSNGPCHERHTPRQVIAGLPRAQTFKRQQSEQRTHLTPVETPTNERRVMSRERRRSSERWAGPTSPVYPDPASGALGPLRSWADGTFSHHNDSRPPSPAAYHQGMRDSMFGQDSLAPGSIKHPESVSVADARSLTTSQYEGQIHDELEKTWILNLSMHFRDRSKREKFFVTYRVDEYVWRRVTISLDYRPAPPDSLEMDLLHTKTQRDKSAKIYEAIRESLDDIQFYDTVTNLKLQTTDGRLHVHVVEDGNEIIAFPTVSQVRHLGCRRIRERDITFDSHMSGFVYKVNVHGQNFIKKEIPSPDTVEEFLYEINALHSLRYSNHVIDFYGVVVDDYDEYVKGLLIGFADQGALIDIIFDNCKESSRGISWDTRQKWARQIVQGLADIHESGYVQGDFTLSNIVIDNDGNAKIIDINRRGCPVGWEPPEATGLLEANYRISMYIGVKSDLYQLGMVLWSLAMLEDEPEAHGRPLMLGPEVNVPDWYRHMTEICLSAEPRMRLQATSLLQMFPRTSHDDGKLHGSESVVEIDDRHSLQEYPMDGYRSDAHPIVRTVEPPKEWLYNGRTYAEPSPEPFEPYYHTRGRSPPSPQSNTDNYRSPQDHYRIPAWAENKHIPSSYSDVDVRDAVTDHDADFPTPMAAGPRIVNLNSDLGMEGYIREKSQERVSGASMLLDSTPKATGYDTDMTGSQIFADRAHFHQAHEDDAERGGQTMPDAWNAAGFSNGELNVQAESVMPDLHDHQRHQVQPRIMDVEEESTAGGARIRSPTPTVEPGQEAMMQGNSMAGLLEDSTSHLSSSFSNSIAESQQYNGSAASFDNNFSTPKASFHWDHIRQQDTPELGYGGSHVRDGTPFNPLDGGAALSYETMQRRPILQPTSAGAAFYPPLVPNGMDITDQNRREGGLPDFTGHNFVPPVPVPVTLTGIGAAHMSMDGDLMRQRCVIDDFDMTTRPQIAPKFAITTEGTT